MRTPEAREARRLSKHRSVNRVYAFLHQLKIQPCKDCGGTFPPECMDFDHVRGTKLFNLAEARCYSWTAIREEVAKCDLVCANCHRIRSKHPSMRVA